MVPDPNLDDDVEGLAATNMTVRWTGHEVSIDARFLNDITFARNVEEFKQAIRSFAVGAQNWVWADVNGDIAYFPYVLLPQRPEGIVPYEEVTDQIKATLQRQRQAEELQKYVTALQETADIQVMLP